MKMTRREILLGGAVTAAVGLKGGTAGAQGAPEEAEGRPPEAVLRLSSQLGVIPGETLEEKLERMAGWGFDAVELDADAIGKEEIYAKAVAAAGLEVSALCWGSCGGDLVSEVVDKRPPARQALERALSAAGAVGAIGVVYVPAFNGETRLRHEEIRKILTDTLPSLGDHAVRAGTRILLEPLNRREAFFLRLLADAAAICRDCHHPGVGMMGDFYHMGIEETSDLGAFISAGEHLYHVHLGSKERVLPGQDERSFVDGFRGLKMIGYRGCCSYECGVRGDRAIEIPRSMRFLRDQWSRA